MTKRKSKRAYSHLTRNILLCHFIHILSYIFNDPLQMLTFCPGAWPISYSFCKSFRLAISFLKSPLKK